MLGIVLELFVVEKELLTGGENELCPAVVALQNSVDKFHGRFPKTGRTVEIGHELGSLPVPFPCLNVLEQQGPGPQQMERRECNVSPYRGRLNYFAPTKTQLSAQFE